MRSAESTSRQLPRRSLHRTINMRETRSADRIGPWQEGNGAPDMKAMGTQISGKFSLEERRDGSLALILVIVDCAAAA